MIETFLIIQFICFGFIAATWERDFESRCSKEHSNMEDRKKVKPKIQNLSENKAEPDKEVNPAILKQEPFMLPAMAPWVDENMEG